MTSSDDQRLSPEQEAAKILEDQGNKQSACLQILSGQFQVIQSRSQLLLTLSTLTLTITGFSGPKIASSSNAGRWCMVAGLALVLIGTILILLQGLSVRWVTQFQAATPLETLKSIIEYRNRKTRFYGIALAFLVLGLASYIGSVILFLIHD